MRARLLVGLALALAACRRSPGPPTGALADLLAAAGQGNVSRVRQIVEEDPGLARESFEGARSGPVRAAADGGHVEVMRLLLRAGADPRERDIDGRTPLHGAKSVEAAALLLESGVSPDVRSTAGSTPLMTCAAAPSVVERLLEAGARPDLRDSDGRTALHHAIGQVGMENVESILALCAYGAEPGVRDEKGESARDLARRSAAEGLGHREQNAVMAALLAPGGGCDALRERAATRRATGEERSVLLLDARCEGGDAWACGRAGWKHEHGEGVVEDVPRAAQLYSRSCDGGHAWGCYALGYAYGEGKGVARDDARAAGLFRKGCDGGLMESCGQLARCLERGRGVPKDERAAVPLFDKACQAGEAWSCWQLGEAYASGRGVARDATRAAALRAQACRGGEKRACAGGSR
ncbi:MAG TPA: ankyrin repeat domain-containing protein [Vicinamibacteria bacterium]|nr:ankyrin repeat domain-containing protein [Vicinamibacteria bacterium]